jgi:hypothetical protein
VLQTKRYVTVCNGFVNAVIINIIQEIITEINAIAIDKGAMML